MTRTTSKRTAPRRAVSPNLCRALFNGDADLIRVCDAFQAADRDIRVWNNADHPLAGKEAERDEELGHRLLERWYRQLGRLIKMQATTEAGIKAKMRAAHLALSDLLSQSVEEREVLVAFSALTDAIGRS